MGLPRQQGLSRKKLPRHAKRKKKGKTCGGPLFAVPCQLRVWQLLFLQWRSKPASFPTLPFLFHCSQHLMHSNRETSSISCPVTFTAAHNRLRLKVNSMN